MAIDHPYHFPIVPLLAAAFFAPFAQGASPGPDGIRPFLEQYCVQCHGGGKVKGKIDFPSLLSSADPLGEHFETWQLARDAIEFGEMPPEDELQPGESEKKEFLTWYQKNFVDSVEAGTGPFQPRRLSVHEYRNTLRSVFGFDLEVAVMEAEQTVSEKSLVHKLLPTDPPGASGFTNDTHGNPLTTTVWEQYSYLVDFGLEELFSPRRRESFEALFGPVHPADLQRDEVESAISFFAARAWRRPPSPSDLEKAFAGLGELSGEALRARFRMELKTILMSPKFFYRGLLVEGRPGEQTTVDAFELAERLSYFLWADMPDEELSRLARSGDLRSAEVLSGQIERLLDHPASGNLSENFAVEWFALDEIRNVSNNPPVADALFRQPVDFVDYLFRENRPLLELIDSEVTFINPHTAKFYPVDRRQLTGYRKQKGIEVEAVPNRKIRIESNSGSRGGLLTMPGVLAMNRGPVIRGTWMLERILGDHLGEPPADVGQIPPSPEGKTLSFRERFEQHRADSTCAVCHDKIDPLGFALQAYDIEGVYLLSEETVTAARRKKDRGEIAIASLDTSGRLPTGETFATFNDLKEILTGPQGRPVVRNMVERTLAYALCRKTEMNDQPTIDDITDRLMDNDATFRDLVHEVVFSLPFQQTTFPREKS